MKRVYNLIVLCILLICQQNIVAQSYNLGKQKQSFAYETLYAKRPQKSQLEKSQVENSQVVKSNNEMVNTQSTQPMASAEDLEKCEKAHKQIMKLASYVSSSVVLSKYENLYKRLPKTKENIQHIQNIQVVVILYINNQGVAFPQIEKQLKNASSMEEEIAVFLSYYKEH